MAELLNHFPGLIAYGFDVLFQTTTRFLNTFRTEAHEPATPRECEPARAIDAVGARFS